MLTFASLLAVMQQGQSRHHFHAGGPHVPLMRAPTKAVLLASATPVVIVEETEAACEIVVTGSRR